ncbi:hypothetical protein [Flammeovirga sp. SJP92]|uniref:hypothetical protein n=1 Tax=Flammeovirga sp. SJP92 TaxID=1775430 RepID=UPI0007884BEB|nr:hypothetical protein [Flammeovirga sp. SJP92]KXX71390.1 hypothetical protein AVL50_05670 [Flammeovirga sp. SJP92]
MNYNYESHSYQANSQPPKKFSWKGALFKFLFLTTFFLFLCVLPFTMMIRSGIYMYHEYAMSVWFGLSAGVVVMTMILLFYLLVGYLLFFRKYKVSFTGIKRIVLTIFLFVITYTIFALFSFTGKNAKTDQIKQEYTQLHPFLKISLRTLLLFDKDVLITSLSREPEDYQKMGLASKSQSLHFVQNTGYVHAMDLRTNGRPIWMIWFSQIYFNTLGFNIVRHNGTGDHLHVSLSTYERQQSW